MNAIVFVVDSADKERIGDAKMALLTIIGEEELKSTTLLVLANKQDSPHALSLAQVSDSLGLTSLRGRQWHICATSAIKGEGITQGFDWLIDAINESAS